MTEPTSEQEHHVDDVEFDELLERSSLGTAGARQLRQRIPHAEAKSISQLADLLKELRQDPEIRSLAQRYAGNPSLAADALQAAFYATAAIKHPDRIDNLRAYFIRVLKHEAYRLCASAIEDPGQHGAAAGPGSVATDRRDGTGTLG